MPGCRSQGPDSGRAGQPWRRSGQTSERDEMVAIGADDRADAGKIKKNAGRPTPCLQRYSSLVTKRLVPPLPMAALLRCVGISLPHGSASCALLMTYNLLRLLLLILHSHAITSCRKNIFVYFYHHFRSKKRKIRYEKLDLEK